MVAMTLVASGESDVLEAQISFHLNAGVSAMVIGNCSPAALAPFEDDARVHAVQGTDQLRQFATRELGADWVIPGRPREFWWPRGAGVEEILSKIPTDYAVVQAIVRPFLAVPSSEEQLFERRVYRLSAQAFVDEPGSSLRPMRRLVHRSEVDVSGYGGEIVPASLRPLRGWYPFEVLWFPDEPEVDLSEAQSGLADDVVQVDTRVRDALAMLGEGDRVLFSRPSVVENTRFAVDAAVLGEGDVLRLRSEIDLLERRLAGMEARIGVRLERKLRALARRGGNDT